MQLYSLQFVCFLLVLLGVYYFVGRRCGRGQWVVLLVGSLGFYVCSGWQNLLFILFTALTTWLIGLWFGHVDEQCKQARAGVKSRKERKAIKARFNHRKWIVLIIGMVLNFAVLGYTKYWNVLLDYVGQGDSFLASNLLLPLGISFYTFTSVSYLIDTYNSKYAPQGNFAKYLLFVSFFPQLIQGPINRYDDMSTQLFERHRFDAHNARKALLLIGFGLLKKYAMADVLVNGISHICDNVDPGMPGCVIMFGVFLYTIQQYGDFSGGIDMVRGVSQLFGIEMAINFRQPYFAVSLSDFWRRWHMSLGAWMRDYAFYPLAVRPSFLKMNDWATKHINKHVGRTLSACVANIIVFFLVGLWHGAESHYILWGLYQGIVIASSDLLRPGFDKLNEIFHVNTKSAGWHVFAILRTFFLVNIGRYFDRLESFDSLTTGFYNTVFNFNPAAFMQGLAMHPTANFTVCLVFSALACIVVFCVSVCKERGGDAAERVLAFPLVARIALYTYVLVLVFTSFVLAGNMGGGFLYANF